MGYFSESPQTGFHLDSDSSSDPPKDGCYNNIISKHEATPIWEVFFTRELHAELLQMFQNQISIPSKCDNKINRNLKASHRSAKCDDSKTQRKWKTYLLIPLVLTKRGQAI